MASRAAARTFQQASRRATASSSSSQILRRSITAAPSGLKPWSMSTSRSFTSSVARFGEGQSDAALASKLGEELAWEKENAAGTMEPEWLTEFKNEGVWSVDDKPGFDEVKLSRTFGNEKIQVLFSIADLDAPSENAEMRPAEEEDMEPEEAESEEPSFPVRTAITVSKGAGQGGLTVDAVAEDGLFVIDAVSFYKDEQQALDMSAEGDWKRRALYMGPEFEALDEGLQEQFEAFLEERGINSNLALFIPDLAEYKEEKEYQAWLSGVKKFVEA